MASSALSSSPAREIRDSVVIRFAGDSGDGMQVTGTQFTLETALAGNDLSTFPDFPAEIRAPAGTTFGVSAFQIQFGAVDVMTPGDDVDVLVAMNPAALTVELKDLRVGGTIIVDTAAFNERNLGKAGYAKNPLDDNSLAAVHPQEQAQRPHVAAQVGLARRQAVRLHGVGGELRDVELQQLVRGERVVVERVLGVARLAEVALVERRAVDDDRAADAQGLQLHRER